ncbi:UNVERIFIED_CONTAM: hypothetical protein GTU68_064222, partial [Idotea baltica]|nr:hypothetical protein [Idotea baltica]
MGVGKTTLIKEIIRLLGVNENVSSPTYSLINEYQSKSNERIYHCDFYRLKSEEEAFDIGIEDYFDAENWCFIEWPERIKNLLPLNSLSVYLSVKEDGLR